MLPNESEHRRKIRQLEQELRELKASPQHCREQALSTLKQACSPEILDDPDFAQIKLVFDSMYRNYFKDGFEVEYEVRGRMLFRFGVGDIGYSVNDPWDGDIGVSHLHTDVSYLIDQSKNFPYTYTDKGQEYIDTLDEFDTFDIPNTPGFSRYWRARKELDILVVSIEEFVRNKYGQAIEVLDKTEGANPISSSKTTYILRDIIRQILGNLWHRAKQGESS